MFASLEWVPKVLSFSYIHYFKSLFRLKWNLPFQMCLILRDSVYIACADPEGGGGGNPDPPKICQRWGLVWMFDGSERGSNGCFNLTIIFFSGSLRSPIFYICQYSNCLINHNHFQVQRVISSPRSSYARFLAFIYGFHKSAFRCLFCLKLHDFTPFKPKIYLGRTPDPYYMYDITHIFYNAKKIMSNVLLCVKNPQGEVIFMKVIVLKAVSMTKLDFDILTVYQEPQCARFRRVLTCTPIV